MIYTAAIATTWHSSVLLDPSLTGLASVCTGSLDVLASEEVMGRACVARCLHISNMFPHPETQKQHHSGANMPWCQSNLVPFSLTITPIILHEYSGHGEEAFGDCHLREHSLMNSQQSFG